MREGAAQARVLILLSHLSRLPRVLGWLSHLSHLSRVLGWLSAPARRNARNGLKQGTAAIGQGVMWITV